MKYFWQFRHIYVGFGMGVGIEGKSLEFIQNFAMFCNNSKYFNILVSEKEWSYFETYETLLCKSFMQKQRYHQFYMRRSKRCVRHDWHNGSEYNLALKSNSQYREQNTWL